MNEDTFLSPGFAHSSSVNDAEDNVVVDVVVVGCNDDVGSLSVQIFVATNWCVFTELI